MSLHFLIDGYNIIHEPHFSKLHKKYTDSRHALLEFIRLNKPCGSSKNRITVVFDGYPSVGTPLKDGYSGIDVLFSRHQSADERIKALIEKTAQPKNLVVVSDDREIKFFAKSSGAKIMGTEEFITLGIPTLSRKAKSVTEKEDMFKPELTFTEACQINRELKKLWLK